MTETLVYTTFQVEGFHSWAKAPEEVAFLRNRHRHLFHFHIQTSVSHDDREIEFLLFRQAVKKLVEDRFCDRVGSCEQVGKWIIYQLIERYGKERIYIVTVSEDGENGAKVIYDPPQLSKEAELMLRAIVEEEGAVDRFVEQVRQFTNKDRDDPPSWDSSPKADIVLKTPKGSSNGSNGSGTSSNSPGGLEAWRCKEE